MHNYFMHNAFMTEMHERLIWARKEAGYETAREAAVALGVREPTYMGHENGFRGFKSNAELYARKFKVNLEWLLTGRGSPNKGRTPTAKAVGYVGAGAEILPFEGHSPGSLEEIEIPPGVPADAVLVIVRGDSMYPRYFENEMLFYVRRTDDPREHVGKECVVALEDGRMLVKILRRSGAKGLFNLESWNAPMIEAVAIQWAAPVLARMNRSKL
jgi:phage repressor protein C with HTH and peptisase S24 domain